MALKRNELLEALDLKRETLRKQIFEETGKNNSICSDEVLKEIAKKKPLKTSDFLAIPGVGNKFIENFASAFLQVLQEYKNMTAKEVTVSRNAYKILDHYKDRLTNISRRNPNLYMGKITQRKSFDLALLPLQKEITDFLTNPKKSILELTFPDSNQGEELYQSLVNLYREVNKDEKETGSYDLYISYPYVEGVFKKDFFSIRAPLLYFPVRIERRKRDFVIRKEKEKDIVFNRDLLLAIAKLEKGEEPKNTPLFQHFDDKVLKNIILPYYQTHGLLIKDAQINFHFESYKPMLKEEFSKQRKSVFKVKEYITLGHFKLYSSMIQKDVSSILDANKYNHLLEGLIEEANLYDNELETKFHIQNYPVDESEISYINEVNYSQEKVISLLNQKQKLVIWGPPGTGKSQTITSLIASAIMKGENVLVVSEKKVALDVIYSRLKNAKNYALFLEDAENKQSFYQILHGFLNPVLPVRTLNNDIYQLEEEINEYIQMMDQSLKLLYVDSIQEIPMYRLYERYVKDKDVLLHLTPKKVHRMFKDSFSAIKFPVLDKIENTFSKKKYLDEMLVLDQILEAFSIIRKLETKVTRSNILEYEEFSNDVSRVYPAYKKAWFLRKAKLRKRLITKYQGKLLFLTKKPKIEKQFILLMLDNPDFLTFMLDNIKSLNKQMTQYRTLDVNEIAYLRMLRTHHLLKTEDNVSNLHSYLFNAFYTGYLEEFKARNQKELSVIDTYQQKLEKLYHLQEEKRMITIESFEMELYKNALNFQNSKRIMDIRRVLESEHKLSIKSFIDQFQVELMNNIRIWMMTPEVVSAVIPLVYGMFDLVIFDEASQMYVEKGIPSIYRAKKVVIAGDTKQLRPSSLGIGRMEDDDTMFEEDQMADISMDAKSLLDLARYRFDETILNYHYRSTYEELIAFSNYAFYDAQLIVSPNQQESVTPPIEYIHVQQGQFINRKNIEEAKKVIFLVKKILRDRQHNESIGIITFNSTQRDLIENYLDDEIYRKGKYQKQIEHELFRQEGNEDKSLFVKNIENVQGDERDIIIFSMGYAKDEEGIVRRRFGWLNNDGGQNRLNVAISRAKKKIYFVTSLLPEEFRTEDLKSTGPKLLKEYMRYCYYISHQKHDLAKNVLESMHKSSETKKQEMSLLIQDIESRLIKSGYQVKTQIGIGNYKIHLAIFDEESKSYKLGIICDVDPYTDLSARRDLLHQEKFLKSRNWTIYRVFSQNWYISPLKEMKAIKDLIKG